MNEMPGLFRAICIITICLALAGLFTVGMGVIGAIGGDAMQNLYQQPMPPGQEKIAEINEQLQRDLKAVTDKWAAVSYVLLAVQLAVVVCLLYGGIQSLRRQPGARQFLVWAMLGAIAFETVRCVPMALIQMEIMGAMGDFAASVERMGNRQMGGFMKAFMSISMLVGIVIGIGWQVFKLAFYALGAKYLTRPSVRDFYEPVESVVVGE